MAKDEVVSQAWVVYTYGSVRSIVPRAGEAFCIVNIPGYTDKTLLITGDGIKNIEQLVATLLLPTTIEKEAMQGTKGIPNNSNRFVTDSDSRIPTQDEKNALSGTEGEPSAQNPFVTNKDTRIPTQSEKDALAGTDGEPSETNPYVTDSDPRVNRTATLPAGIGLDVTWRDDQILLQNCIPVDGQTDLLCEDYEALIAMTWNADTNDTAKSYYKHNDPEDPDNNRDVDGIYFCIPDARGLFNQNSGVNSVVDTYTQADGTVITTVYNGGTIGRRIRDAVRNVIGTVSSNIASGYVQLMTGSGAFYGRQGTPSYASRGGTTGTEDGAILDISRMVPVDTTNHPAGLSWRKVLTI